MVAGSPMAGARLSILVWTREARRDLRALGGPVPKGRCAGGLPRPPWLQGRLAQWESIGLTSRGSLVRSQYRPCSRSREFESGSRRLRSSPSLRAAGFERQVRTPRRIHSATATCGSPKSRPSNGSEGAVGRGAANGWNLPRFPGEFLSLLGFRPFLGRPYKPRDTGAIPVQPTSARRRIVRWSSTDQPGEDRFADLGDDAGIGFDSAEQRERGHAVHRAPEDEHRFIDRQA